jgi:hypothetical protein
MSLLVILGAIAAATVLVGTVLVVSRRLTDSKSSDELAQRLPDGSLINHDSSGGMWDGAADGGGH